MLRTDIRILQRSCGEVVSQKFVQPIGHLFHPRVAVAIFVDQHAVLIAEAEVVNAVCDLVEKFIPEHMQRVAIALDLVKAGFDIVLIIAMGADPIGTAIGSDPVGQCIDIVGRDLSVVRNSGGFDRRNDNRVHLSRGLGPRNNVSIFGVLIQPRVDQCILHDRIKTRSGHSDVCGDSIKALRADGGVENGLVHGSVQFTDIQNPCASQAH